MTRTLAVAGALAILLFAYWHSYVTTVTYPVARISVSVLDEHAETTAAAESTARTMDDLAAWPIAASR